MSDAKAVRRQTVKELKRRIILQAAREVFAAEGLEGASLRTIAARAGYTPAALYFHFDSKEAIYADLLAASLTALGQRVESAQDGTPRERFRAAAMRFFAFYAENPGDLDLGFYLLRGGMRPAGLGRPRDEVLNATLARALVPITAAAEAMGATPERARAATVDVFAHAIGLLLLLHTGRIRMFSVSAEDRMTDYIEALASGLGSDPQ